MNPSLGARADATLGLAASYVTLGDPALWDAYESWHLCAETRVGPNQWAAAVRDVVAPLAAQSHRAWRRARHVMDTVNTQVLLRF